MSMRTSRLLTIITLLVVIFAASCAKERDKPGQSALAALFDPNVPLTAGQEVTATGLIEFNTPEKSRNVFTKYARLKLANGEFGILMDSLGEQMAKTMDGKRVEVKGTLTGESGYDMTASLSSGTTGSVSGASRVPQLKVAEFKAAP
jgi:hypothetical protein